MNTKINLNTSIDTYLKKDGINWMNSRTGDYYCSNCIDNAIITKADGYAIDTYFKVYLCQRCLEKWKTEGYYVYNKQ